MLKIILVKMEKFISGKV